MPIHWGTLWPIGMGRVTPHLLEGPPVEFARYAARGAPKLQVLLPRPGKTVAIPR